MGDSGIGKTSFIKALLKRDLVELNPDQFQIFYTTICLKGLPLLVEIYDIPCSSQFYPFKKEILKNTNVFIICYDLNSISSFTNVISKWIPEVKKNNSESTIICMGLKKDLMKKDVFNLFKYPNFKCSSHSLDGMEFLFRKVTKVISSSNIVNKLKKEMVL